MWLDTVLSTLHLPLGTEAARDTDSNAAGRIPVVVTGQRAGRSTLVPCLTLWAILISYSR